MKIIKYLFVTFVCIFGFLLQVSALSEGVLSNYSFVETTDKTNYIKMEFADGNILLFKLNKQFSSHMKEVKNNIVDQIYDGANIATTPDGVTLNDSTDSEYSSCNNSKFVTYKIGDLSLGSDYEECSSDYLQIQLAENPENKNGPIIGEYLAGNLNSVSLNYQNSVSTIRFVNIKNLSEENGDNGSGSGSNNSNNNNSNQGTKVEQSSVKLCSDDKELLKTFKFLGKILSIIKILIPLIIIFFGVYDFFKAVTASKDEEIKKAMKSVMMRVIAGLIIFFIPTIINVIFRLVDDFNHYETDYSVCTTCIMNPSKCQV